MFDRVYGLEEQDDDYAMELALGDLSLDELYSFVEELTLMKKAKDEGKILILDEPRYDM